MKSGTTTLFDLMAQHPDIVPCKVKEPDFFPNTDGKKLDDYHLYWERRSEDKWLLEASVSYTKYPFVTGVPSSIWEAKLGEVRFVYVLRDPVLRIQSHIIGVRGQAHQINFNQLFPRFSVINPPANQIKYLYR